MNSIQLYLSIGIPSALFALNFLAILWQARGITTSLGARIDQVNTSLGARIDALEKVMNARFDAAHQSLLRVEGILDARLKHLEDERLR